MRNKKWVKWFLLSITILFFILSLIFYLIDHKWPTGEKRVLEITKIVLLITSLVLLNINCFFLAVKSILNKNKDLKKRLESWSEISYHVSNVNSDVVSELPVAIIVTDDEGKCQWGNQAAYSIFSQEFLDKQIRDISSDIELGIKSKKDTFTISYNNEKYDVLRKNKSNSYFFFNVTSREKIKEKYSSRIPVVAIISFDNLEEAMSTLDISLQSNVKGQYLSEIADWAQKYNAFLKTYSNEKLLLIAYRSELEQMIKDKFDILEKIRNISFKYSIIVSISVGIASWDISLNDLSIYAQNAVELAEKRGGDQVVVNIENKEIQYFGAKLDQEGTNSKVGSRIKSENLKRVVNSHNHIYVMGHINADTDAYGAMIGLSKMLIAEGKDNVFIVLDYEKLDNTVQKIHNILIEEDSTITKYLKTTEEVLQQCDENSLLVVVDTQSKKLVSSKEVFEKIKDKAIIDHHRASDDSFSGIFEYLEPSSSSTSELLVELMEFYVSKKNKIQPIVASVLYSGILVDTNNFAQRTGAKTFEAASKLKEYGADINEVRKWLRKDMQRLFLINELIAKAEFVFDKKFALTISETIVPDTVLPAQVADELLQIDGVEAAFAITPLVDNSIAVSARSIGTYNVQLIMESIGGGGHFAAAAAKIKDKSATEIYDEIINLIKNDMNLEGDNMKVILIKDLANRGIKDDVIEVNFNYGQFLIKSNIALEATPDVLKKHEEELIRRKEEEAQRVIVLQKLAEEISDKQVNVKVQVGADGKLFGRVTTMDIVEEFQKQNKIILDKRKVKLLSDINSLGIYIAVVDLGNSIQAKFTVNVLEM